MSIRLIFQAGQAAATAEIAAPLDGSQLAVPDSPYHFPPQFQRDVRGSLPYDDVIDYRDAGQYLGGVNFSRSAGNRWTLEIGVFGGAGERHSRSSTMSCSCRGPGPWPRFGMPRRR